MMTEDQARFALKALVQKYLESTSEREELIRIIEDRSRPGLPVRGVLERLKVKKSSVFSDADKDQIDELIYLYG